MQKNEIFRGEITGLTSRGMGVARLSGQAIFIPGGIPGETVEARLSKVSPSAMYARLQRVSVPSPHRVQPDCPHFPVCGGCVFRHMDYACECQWKRRRVEDALERIGGFCVEPVPFAPATRLIGYRNKIQLPIASYRGRAEAGYFMARTHSLIPVYDCLLVPTEANLAARALIQWMWRFHVPAYDEKTGKGLIRHLYIRRGAVSQEVMVCLVANSDRLPKAENLVVQLRRSVPGLHTVLLNCNKRPGNTILGDQYHVLWGQGTIEDTLCGLRFRLSPASFYQVNHDQAEVLYKKVIDLAALSGEETVLDLCCGAGTITLSMAAHARMVIGAEVVADAVRDAKVNASRNRIQNAHFLCADAGDAARRLISEGTHPDVITLDPPRKGVSQDTLSAIAALSPARVVYISCDPATAARDLSRLAAYGYTLSVAEAVDMFPRCGHVETVVLMSRKGA